MEKFTEPVGRGFDDSGNVKSLAYTRNVKAERDWNALALDISDKQGPAARKIYR